MPCRSAKRPNESAESSDASGKVRRKGPAFSRGAAAAANMAAGVDDDGGTSGATAGEGDGVGGGEGDGDASHRTSKRRHRRRQHTEADGSPKKRLLLAVA